MPLSPRQSTVAHPLDLVESLYLDQGVEVEGVTSLILFYPLL